MRHHLSSGCRATQHSQLHNTEYLVIFQRETAILRTWTCTRTYGNVQTNLPSVDSLGEFVAFQGPPKLTALDISPLHIPRHLSPPQRKRRARGALQETGEKKQADNRDGGYISFLSACLDCARGTHNTRFACKEKTLAGVLTRAPDFYQSLLLSFVCGQTRGFTVRWFMEQLIGPSHDMALDQRTRSLADC